MTTIPLDRNARLHVLHQLLASATHDASAAMCRWTDGLITLSLDEVQELPLETATSELNLGDEMFVMVVLSVQGLLGGELILMFDEENGRRLAASLLNRPVRCEGHWSELEKSALTETGNILGCAYINALTRLIDHELLPTAPYFLQDYGASVLEQALLVQAATTDRVLISRTAFRREGEQLHWHMLFVPSEAMRLALERALHAAPSNAN